MRVCTYSVVSDHVSYDFGYIMDTIIKQLFLFFNSFIFIDLLLSSDMCLVMLGPAYMSRCS